MATDVDECAQLAIATSDHHDRDIAGPCREELPGLRDVGADADVLPGTPKDPFLLEPQDGRVRVPGGRQGESLLELGAKFGAEVDGHGRSARAYSRASTIRSPTITAGRFVFARGMTGIREQSATTTPSSPRTRPAPSQTASGSVSLPIAHVPTGW